MPSSKVNILSFNDNMVAIFVDENDCAFGPVITTDYYDYASNIAEQFIAYIDKRFHCSIIGIDNKLLSIYYKDFLNALL